MRRMLPLLFLSSCGLIQAQNEELFAHYQAVLLIDTTDPPGNKTKVADYIKGVFEKERKEFTEVGTSRLPGSATIGKQFSAGFVNSPVARGPFTLHALPLAAIEFAQRNVVRNIADDVALHQLNQPLQRASSHGTVSLHSDTPHRFDPSWHY